MLQYCLRTDPVMSCMSFEVPVIDDDIVEGVQSLELILISPFPQLAVNNTDLIRVYIEDNDSEC